MGFYIRKSISVGPLRFNLSKSGIGVSAGVKGLRFGVGPRGNYVQMGRGGLYYRAAIPHSSHQPAAYRRASSQVNPQAPPETDTPLEDIESADAAQIVDSSASELLDEMNQKQKRMRSWPAVAVLSTAVIGVGFPLGWPIWLLIALTVVGTMATSVAGYRDTLAKTVVVFYNLDSQMEYAYTQLHGWAEKLSSCSAVWHIEARGNVENEKYHAGANQLIRRKQTFVRKQEPPHVRTNIETFAVGVGQQTLHFFPDRVFVYDQHGVGAVAYERLRVDVIARRFVETDSVPADANVVGITWKYVNKSGGPDRRFRDNKEIPLCLYEEITLSSPTGLKEVLQVSKAGLGKGFADAIAVLGKRTPQEDSYSSGPEVADAAQRKRTADEARSRNEQRDSSKEEMPPPQPPTGKEWFSVLMVQPTASVEEIKEAYRRRMSEYHPDKVATLGAELRALAEQKSKEINAAFIEAAKALKGR